MMKTYEAQILQNGDVPVSDTDTSRILADTYSQIIRIIILIFKK